jgi:hypothetical protein
MQLDSISHPEDEAEPRPQAGTPETQDTTEAEAVASQGGEHGSGIESADGTAGDAVDAQQETPPVELLELELVRRNIPYVKSRHRLMIAVCLQIGCISPVGRALQTTLAGLAHLGAGAIALVGVPSLFGAPLGSIQAFYPDVGWGLTVAGLGGVVSGLTRLASVLVAATGDQSNRELQLLG